MAITTTIKQTQASLIDQVIQQNPDLASRITNSQLSSLRKQDQSVFIELLVEAILGVSITNINESVRAEIVSECINLFNDFIAEYLKVSNRKSYIQFKAITNSNNPKLTSKLDVMDSEIKEAFNVFLTTL
jgi:hypothetical protein